MSYSSYQPSTVQRSPRRKYIWLAAAGFILLLVLAFFLWSSSDNKANISNQSSGKTAAAVPDKTFNSQYVTFIYKGTYLQKSRTTQPGVEQTLLKASTTFDKTLAVEIQPLPSSGGLGADSGYSYRQLHPELYTSQQITLDGAPATEWVKNDGKERTIYQVHGSSYVVISFSLSSTNDIAGLPAEVSAMLQSFHWK
jgi:hypothetical protein